MTTKPAWDIFTGATKEISEGLAAGAYVDVRDVATITTYAIEHPNEVAGERFPLVAGSGPPQAIADILRESFPERQHLIPEGQRGKGYQPGTWGFVRDSISFSSKLVEDLTRIDWIPFDKSIKDTVKSFLDAFGI
jgi:nucleoside-diphosphate-sugar epimerase